MNLEQLVIWIVIGGIAGLLADSLVKGIRLGVVGAVIVGILGAVLGGWLFGLLDISVGSGFLADIVVAFIGAVVLLLILKAIRRR